MPSTMSEPLRSAPIKSLDGLRPNPAKAALPVNGGQRTMTAIVKDALLQHFGAMKTAAFAMGEMDEGQLSRELDTGKFKFERLELLDADAKHAVIEALNRVYVIPADPRIVAARLLRQAHRALDDIAETFSL